MEFYGQLNNTRFYEIESKLAMSHSCISMYRLTVSAQLGVTVLFARGGGDLKTLCSLLMLQAFD
jgi:hypothetical protein